MFNADFCFKKQRSVHVSLTEQQHLLGVISPRCFIMSSDSTMSDPNLDKKLVYLAYRDVFNGKLAKLRKPKKVRNVVEKHKDHLHHKQLADTMDSEKTCRILGPAGFWEIF